MKNPRYVAVVALIFFSLHPSLWLSSDVPVNQAASRTSSGGSSSHWFLFVNAERFHFYWNSPCGCVSTFNRCQPPADSTAYPLIGHSLSFSAFCGGTRYDPTPIFFYGPGANFNGGQFGAAGCGPERTVGVNFEDGVLFWCFDRNVGGAFGGSYSRSSSGGAVSSNPFTDKYSCPSGFAEYPLDITASSGTTFRRETICIDADPPPACTVSAGCNGVGTASASGDRLVGCSCICRTGFTGASCGQCAPNYQGASCTPTPCASSYCNNHGTPAGFIVSGCSCASCTAGYTGATCNQCAVNYQGYPTCAPIPCTRAADCTGHGAASGTRVSGCTCVCDTGYEGSMCSRCTPDYEGYPVCVRTCTNALDCNRHASSVQGNVAVGCRCTCLGPYRGISCADCNEGYVARRRDPATCVSMTLSMSPSASPTHLSVSRTNSRSLTRTASTSSSRTYSPRSISPSVGSLTQSPSGSLTYPTHSVSRPSPTLPTPSLSETQPSASLSPSWSLYNLCFLPDLAYGPKPFVKWEELPTSSSLSGNQTRAATPTTGGHGLFTNVSSSIISAVDASATAAATGLLPSSSSASLQFRMVDVPNATLVNMTRLIAEPFAQGVKGGPSGYRIAQLGSARLAFVASREYLAAAVANGTNPWRLAQSCPVNGDISSRDTAESGGSISRYIDVYNETGSMLIAKWLRLPQGGRLGGGLSMTNNHLLGLGDLYLERNEVLGRSEMGNSTSTSSSLLFDATSLPQTVILLIRVDWGGCSNDREAPCPIISPPRAGASSTPPSVSFPSIENSSSEATSRSTEDGDWWWRDARIPPPPLCEGWRNILIEIPIVYPVPPLVPAAVKVAAEALAGSSALFEGSTAAIRGLSVLGVMENCRVSDAKASNHESGPTPGLLDESPSSVGYPDAVIPMAPLVGPSPLAHRRSAAMFNIAFLASLACFAMLASLLQWIQIKRKRQHRKKHDDDASGASAPPSTSSSSSRKHVEDCDVTFSSAAASMRFPCMFMLPINMFVDGTVVSAVVALSASVWANQSAVWITVDATILAALFILLLALLNAARNTIATRVLPTLIFADPKVVDAMVESVHQLPAKDDGIPHGDDAHKPLMTPRRRLLLKISAMAYGSHVWTSRFVVLSAQEKLSLSSISSDERRRRRDRDLINQDQGLYDEWTRKEAADTTLRLGFGQLFEKFRYHESTPMDAIPLANKSSRRKKKSRKKINDENLDPERSTVLDVPSSSTSFLQPTLEAPSSSTSSSKFTAWCPYFSLFDLAATILVSILRGLSFVTRLCQGVTVGVLIVTLILFILSAVLRPFDSAVRNIVFIASNGLTFLAMLLFIIGEAAGNREVKAASAWCTTIGSMLGIIVTGLTVIRLTKKYGGALLMFAHARLSVRSKGRNDDEATVGANASAESNGQEDPLLQEMILVDDEVSSCGGAERRSEDEEGSLTTSGDDDDSSLVPTTVPERKSLPQVRVEGEEDLLGGDQEQRCTTRFTFEELDRALNTAVQFETEPSIASRSEVDTKSSSKSLEIGRSRTTTRACDGDDLADLLDGQTETRPSAHLQVHSRHLLL